MKKNKDSYNRDLEEKFTNLFKSGKLDHTKTDLSAIPDDLIHEICETEEALYQISILYLTLWAIHYKGDTKRGTVELTDDEMENGSQYFFTKFNLENLKRHGKVKFYSLSGEPFDEDGDINIQLTEEGIKDVEAVRKAKDFRKLRSSPTKRIPSKRIH